MNKVVLMGRLTRDPEVRYSNGNPSIAVARYTLAVDRRQKNEDGSRTADFISCVALGKNGEFAEKHLKKGTKIVVSGRIQTGNYTGKDGNKVYTTDVIVEEHEFAESRKDNSARDAMDDEMAAGYAAKTQQGSAESAAKTQQSAIDGFMQLPGGIDEELPFA